MSVTVDEKFESRTGDQATIDLIFVVRGTDNDLEAKAALVAVTPGTYGGLVRQWDNIRVEPKGPQLWEGTVRYGKPERNDPATGESSFSFDTGGGTQHITQSLATVHSYDFCGTAPDFGGAIGVTQDSVEGVDITVPVYQFAETHYLAPEVVTDEYKGTLFRLTGKVNSGAFRGCQAGECLFLGASGSKRGQGDWEITFKFAASPNVTGLTVGEITGIEKKGWEYMWVRYEDTEDNAANVIVKKPTSVYIEKVYELANFSGLGIG